MLSPENDTSAGHWCQCRPRATSRYSLGLEVFGPHWRCEAWRHTPLCAVCECQLPEFFSTQPGAKDKTGSALCSSFGLGCKFSPLGMLLVGWWGVSSQLPTCLTPDLSHSSSNVHILLKPRQEIVVLHSNLLLETGTFLVCGLCLFSLIYL